MADVYVYVVSWGYVYVESSEEASTDAVSSPAVSERASGSGYEVPMSYDWTAESGTVGG